MSPIIIQGAAGLASLAGAAGKTIAPSLVSVQRILSNVAERGATLDIDAQKAFIELLASTGVGVVTKMTGDVMTILDTSMERADERGRIAILELMQGINQLELDSNAKGKAVQAAIRQRGKIEETAIKESGKTIRTAVTWGGVIFAILAGGVAVKTGRTPTALESLTKLIRG